MAKLKDKFFNRVIEGDFELGENESLEVKGSGELKAFENIVDAQGHARFVEGDGTPYELTGYTPSYYKWSLSGSHLLLVVAGKFADTTSITNSDIVAFKLPKWVYDKIYPVWQNWIEAQTITLINDDWTSQQCAMALRKGGDDSLVIRITGSVTMTKERNFRCQFDLLVDNE